MQSRYYSGNTLGELRLTWYSHIDPDETTEIVNTLKRSALAGETIFYDIYTEEEKTAEPAKEDTGHTDYSGQEPPTFVCVGDRDGIADWRTMEQRQNTLSSLGIETEFHVYEGLGHGFGLGTGTAAEGWLDEAAEFWRDKSTNRRRNKR